MKIVINRKGGSQTPKIIIDTKKCHYPYAIRDSIKLALELDGLSKETIDEVFGKMPESECVNVG